ncbi:MAG: hypothetical protein KF823_14685 [Xanthomonadales bacterium]|nr:hypothetical protein [Xanthomonadales bacterium]
MPLPDMPSPDIELTDAEQHMISRVLNEGNAGRLAFEMAYLIPAGVLVGIGLMLNARPAFAAALGIVAAFRFYAMQSDSAMLPVLQSAILKLKAQARRARG